jgi:hypothetical protein
VPAAWLKLERLIDTLCVTVPVYVEAIVKLPPDQLPTLSIVTFLVDVLLNVTAAVPVGTASPDQLAAVDQLLSAPPPSHVWAKAEAQASKVATRRYTTSISARAPVLMREKISHKYSLVF